MFKLATTGWRAAVGPALVGLAGLRVIWLLTARYAGGAAVESFRLDSAVSILLAVGLAVRVALVPRATPETTTASGTSLGSRVQAAIPGRALWWWIGCVLAAFVLYRPALSIGLLSDDFGHFVRAGDWSLGPVTPSFFRPLPIALWALVRSAGGGAVTFHALNILLHGATAYLTIRLADGWLPGRRSWAPIAGALFLVNPLAPEAVAWASGIFDVSATTCVLALVLMSRTARGGMAWRLALLSVLAVALGCKETAVVAPVLVLIDAWVRRDLRRSLLRDAAVGVAMCVGFSAFRLIHAFGVSAPPLTKYVIQRSLFETFGALAAPWHADVILASAWIPLVVGLLLVVMCLAVCLWSDVPLRPLGGAALWILVSIAPVFPIVVIGMDLQGSRYLYLGSAAWSAGLAVLVATMRVSAVRLSFAAGLALTIVLMAVSVGRELHPWREAAGMRDAVLRAIGGLPSAAACPALALRDLPDNVRGAYVLRTDAEAAVRVTVGRALVNEAAAPCTFTWRAGGFN